MARLDDALTDERIEAYSRQILLPELGGRGQRRLLHSSCLLVGDDRAVAFAATYLAGAGIGHVDLLHGADAAAGAPELAELADRSADARAHRLLAAPASLSRYDVVLASEPAAPRLARSCGAPRSGSIRIEARGSEGVDLSLLPRTADVCVICARAVEDARSGEEPRPRPNPSARDDLLRAEEPRARPISSASAGTLAALAAIRWLAGIGDDTTARALRLAPGDPLWREVGVRGAAGCPRGCRASGAPVA